jgi:hypothetical protein
MGLIVFNCKNETKNSDTIALKATEIIDKTIEVSGGNNFENSVIQFDFRAITYKAKREKGKFELSRLQLRAEDSIFDIIDNTGFKRLINNKIVKVDDSLATLYTASVNSVHYFSVLPFGLNDKAVNKSVIGEEQIKDKMYFKIKVTFNPNGGGEDYEDVFIYWVDKESYKVDYLAYSYNEEDGIGMRFRAAYNERFVNGLRFVDYTNYKTENQAIALADLGVSFEKNQLKLLSKIELLKVSVQLINN